jgi:peptide/nickel transport system permease protein
MNSAINLALRFGRTLLVVLLVIFGSTLLVRFAPGYWSDARELDSHYAAGARRQLAEESARSGSIVHLLASELSGYAHGNFGDSREYEVPVKDLLVPRLAVTGSLMLRAIGLGWALALGAAILSSTARKSSRLWQVPSTLILAVPTAALVTLCLFADLGGPVLVMTLLLAARDFKFMNSLLRKVSREPHLLQARAHGIRQSRLLIAHILPSVRSELLALATLSLVTALSALVPVEVLFSIPGVGQLAWNAAMNRDLPVLLAVTVLMAIAVSAAGMLGNSRRQLETA